MLKLIIYVLNYCAEFKQLLLEDFEEEPEESELFYPELGDPNFGYKIFHKNSNNNPDKPI